MALEGLDLNKHWCTVFMGTLPVTITLCSSVLALSFAAVAASWPGKHAAPWGYSSCGLISSDGSSLISTVR